MNYYIDYTQITELSRLRAIDTDGTEFTAEDVVIVPIVFTDAIVLVGDYTPGDAIEPSIAQSIASAVLDALKSYTGE